MLMGCPTQCLAQDRLTSILTKLGLTRRCSRRLAGLFTPAVMIKILQEIAARISLLNHIIFGFGIGLWMAVIRQF